MRMKGVEVLYGKNNPVKKAFYAGNDIILMKYSKDEKLIENIINEIKNSPLKQARINRSVKRILKTKEKYMLNDRKIVKDENLKQNINTRIKKVKEII